MRQQPQGSGSGGFNPSSIHALARDSYRASDIYSKITKKLAGTDDAHRHLTNSDGEATAADREVVEILNEFESYLKTSTARYYECGERLVKAAKNYHDTEEGNQEDIDAILDLQGDADYDGPGKAGKEAEETKRPEARPGATEAPARFEGD
jgi:hypothetical protein